MVILMIMAVGILVGLKCFPEKWSKYNHYVQLVSIVLLIFCMGVSLGSNPTFMEQLVSMGFKGVVFAVVPILGSIGCVYVLSEKFMKNKED
ncbi:MAG: LysO family transporter [Cellulosilyticaceae bacterium]